MTKSELIQRSSIANKNLSEEKIAMSCEIIFGEISNALSQGDRVELRGFGIFSTRERKPKQIKNPKTGDIIFVAAKKVPFFKASKQLNKKINI